MPKGHAVVMWNAENVTKLFKTILAVHDVKIDYAKVAAAFGPNVPASCISLQMGKMRKAAMALGVAAQPTPVATNIRARTSAAPKAGSSITKRKRVPKESESDDEEESMGSGGTEGDDEKATLNGLQTPEPEAKRRKRSSPRSLVKKDYRDLDDPYTGMATEDAEGNVVFEDEKVSEEDSADDDGEYGNPSSAANTV